ncbi:MAG: DegT/DnrJ/EryC1/StrS family aminotransferase [Methanoregula sp.]|uniref:DegT/DnrJ/EryC1/StrS family aminotransferase n=1 Tax=Methanoregula sp. TaxID=2052170 RepID=UPI0025D28241|nr:DegT/DnrJ/EryC1/StrS family aminotransferase [Methanoregula sp.]MCK9630279.1 DegT/DnrJ/EryC1/StrS family aminotransferase [Methanoregula sp.]
MTWKIPLFKMYWDDEDVASVNAAIKTGMNWALGPQIPAFERKIAEYVGTKYCLTFNSGTSALHAALLSYGIGIGDEVIIPSFTFIATANAPKFVGATPVFADIEDATFGLDPADVEAKITPRTKAIVPIHFGGFPCQVRELRKIADEHDIVLIEDAAEAMGATVGGRYVGTFGDSSILSFCQNKIITTGEGGAVVTDNRDLYEKMKLVRSHGRPDTLDYFSTIEVLDYVSLGYNFRISTMTAALGIAQLDKIGRLIGIRKSDAAYYRAGLAEVPGVVVPPEQPDTVSVYQLFSIRAKKRDALMKYLEGKGIMTKIYFPPVHKTHYYQNVLRYTSSLPMTDTVSGDIVSLPFYPGITRDEMDTVIQAIREFGAKSQ